MLEIFYDQHIQIAIAIVLILLTMGCMKRKRKSPVGATIFLVGECGAGKTTLFYQVIQLMLAYGP